MQTNVNRSRNFFKSILPILTFFCLMLLVEVAVMEVYFFIAAWTSGKTDFYDFLDYFLEKFIGDGSIISMFIYGFIALFVSLFWYRTVLEKQKNIPDYLADSKKYELLTGDGNHFTNYKKICIIALIVSAIGFQIVMQFFMVGLAKLAPSWAEEYQELLKATGLGESKLSWMMVIYILVGPFSEECASGDSRLSIQGNPFHSGAQISFRRCSLVSSMEICSRESWHSYLDLSLDIFMEKQEILRQQSYFILPSMPRHFSLARLTSRR